MNRCERKGMSESVCRTHDGCEIWIVKGRMDGRTDGRADGHGRTGKADIIYQ